MDVGVVVDGARFADRVPSPHVVLELVGGAYVAEDVRCLQTLGRIVLVGLLAGAKGELDLRLVMHKRARILGTMLRSRPLEEKLAAMRAFETEVVPLFARGALKPVVDCVLDLATPARRTNAWPATPGSARSCCASSHADARRRGLRALRDSLAKGLRELGYAVDATGDGTEGAWFAANHGYDVVILDLMLPARAASRSSASCAPRATTCACWSDREGRDRRSRRGAGSWRRRLPDQAVRVSPLIRSAPAPRGYRRCL